MARMAEADVVERLLVDRRRDERARLIVETKADRTVDRLDRAGSVRRIDSARRITMGIDEREHG